MEQLSHILNKVLPIIKLIVVYGSKIAAAIEFPVSIADKFCGE